MGSQDKPAPDVAEQLTCLNLVRSLKSTRCPACGQTKGGAKTFCYACFAKLAPDQQRALYQRLDDGYETALLRALRVLGARQFILPDAPPGGPWGSAEREPAEGPLDGLGTVPDAEGGAA